MAARETKTFTVEMKAGAEGKFKALISTFNVPDKRGDIVRPGAFKATLAQWRAKKKPIPVVFDHQVHDPHMYIGEASSHDSQETATGFVVIGQLDLNDERGAKVHRQLLRGTLDQWSYSFIPRQARPLPDGGRELLDVDLLELGPTLLGVGDTETIEVRSATASRAASSLTAAQRLVPFRAHARRAQLRVDRWRQNSR